MSYKGDDTTGFQSPAQGYTEDEIDLMQLLDLRGPNIWPYRLEDPDMKLLVRGLRNDDILIVNTDRTMKEGRIAIAFAHGNRVTAPVSFRNGTWMLVPSSGDPIPVTEDVEIWAMVDRLVRTKV